MALTGPGRLSRPIAFVFVLALWPAAVKAATVQNFASGGTPYASSTCAGGTGPQVLVGGPGGSGNYLRLLPSNAINSQSSIAFQTSDRGAFTTIQIQFDFRMTPQSPTSRADGFGVVLLNTAQHDTVGGRCSPAKRPTWRALSAWASTSSRAAARSTTTTSRSTATAPCVTALIATPITNLASGQWIRARIVVRPGGGRPTSACS